MSKNTDRYKKDFSHLDAETLEGLETESFEHFHPKKKLKKVQSEKKARIVVDENEQKIMI